MSAPPQSDASALAAQQALQELGVRCAVEARGKLAVVIPAAGERALEDAAKRRTVLTALRSHGFTHAAVEPPDSAMG